MPLRRASWTALALAAALIAAPPAASPAGATQEFRFEGTAFEPPGGGWVVNPDTRPGIWQAQRRFEEGRDRGAALIQVARPIPAFEGPFDAVFTRLAASIPGLERERPTMRGEGVTAAGHRIRHESRCCTRRNDVSIGTETVGISDGRRHAVLMLVSMGLRGDSARKARADFDAFVRSFRLDAAEPSATLAPPEGAGGLEGTFTHLSTGVMPNAFGGIDFRAENEVRVFDKGGLYSRAVPSGEEDVAAHCRRVPADCGTYRLIGGGMLRGPDRIEFRDMTSRYGLIEVKEKPFARDGENLRIGGDAHRRVPPLPRGTVFDGTWRYFFASSGSTAFSSGSVAVERLLTLSRDGRFRRTGFTGASSSNEAGGGRTGFTSGRERPAESGRYEAEGYRLTLVGDDGRRESFSLILPDPGKDGLLVIDGNNYLRRDGK
ncbi:hypothetical protein [Roseomonas indoligenes]|uniref:Uncharacterized protein n=1 Tax=Roseomonas indoligenes TaxID=2820811 RepID=A0A940S8M6_9PROT|nr:hypothetical protein [Pararoseomonas indoligenes]MBP0494262.1 hypothetical protein [Pararoseomonas indoligenes]